MPPPPHRRQPPVPMFTGIIEAVGEVRAARRVGADARLIIGTGDLDMTGARVGESIACNGVCLTAVECGADFYAADVSAETLSCTTLGGLRPGAMVNLEQSITPAGRLGGHIVSGHVDGVGRVLNRVAAGRSQSFTIAAPADLRKYIAAKGAVCVDGVSLTVNRAGDDRFEVNIIPHTLQSTALGELRAGAAVNLEIDVVARYIERLMQGAAKTG